MGCGCGQTRSEVMSSVQAEQLRQQRELERRIAEEQAKVADKPVNA